MSSQQRQKEEEFCVVLRLLDFLYIQLISIHSKRLRKQQFETKISPNTTPNSKKSKEPLPSLLSQPKGQNMQQPSIKSQQYQSKINQLSNMVKVLRQKLKYIEGEGQRERERESEGMAELRVENGRLMRENKALRGRVYELQRKLRQAEDKERSKDKDIYRDREMRGSGYYGLQTAKSQGNLRWSTTSKQSQSTTLLLRQLLAQCHEPSQSLFTSHRPQLKDQFYQFKSSADCFSPWLDQLPSEGQIRLKRCLTREKELLWGNSQLELGCICPYLPGSGKQDTKVRILLVLTNIGLETVRDISMEVICGKDVVIIRNVDNLKNSNRSSQQTSTGFNRWHYSKQLRPNDQIKQQLEVIINSVDFRCLQLQLTYALSFQPTTHTQLLILPLSKSKLFKILPYSSPPLKPSKLQRVFIPQRKVLPTIGKITKMWACLESKDKIGGEKVHWKLQFNGRVFWISAGKVDQRVFVAVKYQNQRALAEKVLDQYVFLFQKQ